LSPFGNGKKMMNIIIIILDFGEFLIAISITAQQDPKKKLEWAFSMYGM
jgi:Ca2+-binding EF-hand superfamily protein